ncbi:hypothetical protein RND81_09G003700 [Saponaria officinalis]|uniref:Secologanin synthase n=1 Tax=Saponaria officinalis TaxID=3572 RepID=A0AAW1IH59_SAPOF
MLMVPAFNASISDMVEKWKELASNTGSCEVDAWSYLHKLSADVILRAAFGSSYEEGRKIFELITDQIKLAVPVATSVYISGWKFVPTKRNRRMKQNDKEITSLLKGIINKRQMAIRAGEKAKDDLLGILLESCGTELGHSNNSNSKKQNVDITLEEVIDECKIFYLAGQETTSTLLLWTLVLLAKHQDWQARARLEVLNAFGLNISPDFHALNHLKTINMILQEALRLYPPKSELLRIVSEDIKVGDIFLPAGVLVNLPILDIQHDEKLWGSDVKEFNPNRFSEGIAKLALVLILQHFTFELSSSYVHAPVVVSTLQPQFGAPMIFKLSH